MKEEFDNSCKVVWKKFPNVNDDINGELKINFPSFLALQFSMEKTP